MRAVAALAKRYRAERARGSLQPSPVFGDAGLTLGRGTVLARHALGASGQDLTDGGRLTVLLSAVHGRAVSPDVAKRAARRQGACPHGMIGEAPTFDISADLVARCEKLKQGSSGPVSTAVGAAVMTNHEAWHPADARRRRVRLLAWRRTGVGVRPRGGDHRDRVLAALPVISSFSY